MSIVKQRIAIVVFTIVVVIAVAVISVLILDPIPPQTNTADNDQDAKLPAQNYQDNPLVQKDWRLLNLADNSLLGVLKEKLQFTDTALAIMDDIDRVIILNTQTEVREICNAPDDKSTILYGCWGIDASREILVIYNADKAVRTLAHEFLHAVYARHTAEELRKLKILLEEDYDNNRQLLDDRLELYGDINEATKFNELHSFIATDVKTLTPALNEYYAQFFKDRQIIQNESAPPEVAPEIPQKPVDSFPSIPIRVITTPESGQTLAPAGVQNVQATQCIDGSWEIDPAKCPIRCKTSGEILPYWDTCPDIQCPDGSWENEWSYCPNYQCDNGDWVDYDFQCPVQCQDDSWVDYDFQCPVQCPDGTWERLEFNCKTQCPDGSWERSEFYCKTHQCPDGSWVDSDFYCPVQCQDGSWVDYDLYCKTHQCPDGTWIDHDLYCPVQCPDGTWVSYDLQFSLCRALSRSL